MSLDFRSCADAKREKRSMSQKKTFFFTRSITSEQQKTLAGIYHSHWLTRSLIFPKQIRNNSWSKISIQREIQRGSGIRRGLNCPTTLKKASAMSVSSMHFKHEYPDYINPLD